MEKLKQYNTNQLLTLLKNNRDSCKALVETQFNCLGTRARLLLENDEERRQLVKEINSRITPACVPAIKALPQWASQPTA